MIDGEKFNIAMLMKGNIEFSDIKKRYLNLFFKRRMKLCIA